MPHHSFPSNPTPTTRHYNTKKSLSNQRLDLLPLLPTLLLRPCTPTPTPTPYNLHLLLLQQLLLNLLLRLIVHLHLIVASLSELIHAAIINSIYPRLVQCNKVDNVVAQRRKTMQRRHLNRECEEVVDEAVQVMLATSLPGV